MSLPSFSVRNSVLVNLVMILIIAMGAYSLITLPRELMPQIRLNRVVVAVSWPGAAPEDVEKLITKAKRAEQCEDPAGKVHFRRLAARHIQDRKVLSKLFNELASRYAERPGGYTRIVKMGPRQGDCAAMSIIELVDNEIEFED